MAYHRIHELTAGELATLRSPYQGVDLFLAIWPRFDAFADATVWTGRVNGAPASDDQVYEITYDGGSGTHANCLPDQMLFVGTVPGAYDKGIARIRTAPPANAGTLRIAETSEIQWDDDDYLTIVDYFGIWARHIYITDDGDIYMERGYYDEGAAAYVDGSYTDQLASKDPVPVIGPDRVVLVDGVVSAIVPVEVSFDGGDSYEVDGGAVTFDWNDSDGLIVGGATSTPTFTYIGAGIYRVVCHLTSGSEVHTAYRRVHVYDDNNPPITQFDVTSMPAGGISGGGWSFGIRMWDEARRSEIIDGAKVIMFARDVYSSTEASVGPIYSDDQGLIAANMLCIGWISGESITYHRENGSVDFDVEGLHYWLEHLPGFPHGIEDHDGAPTDWYEMNDNQVRKSLWSLLRWRTTLTRITDCYIPDDTRLIKEYEAGVGSLWRQIQAGCWETIFARPLSDRYCRLIVEIPYNMLPAADRGTVVGIMEILTQDWREEIHIVRRSIDDMSMLDLSGVYYLDANTAEPFFMLAYGHVMGRWGAIEHQERLVLHDNQADNNVMAALLCAAANNEYPAVDYAMRGNYRVFDIAPRMYVTQSITEPDTERGIVWSGKKLVPVEVGFSYDPETKMLTTTMTCEGETDETDAIGGPGDPPPEPPAPPPIPPPPTPPIPLPELEYDIGAVVMNDDQIAFCFDIEADAPVWYDGDPGGDMGGTFHNCVCKGGKAYVTTSYGLYYCEDVTTAQSGTISWSLVKSQADAQTECGYVGAAEFRAIDMDDSGDFLAAFHGNMGGAGQQYKGFVYYGSDGVVDDDSPLLLPMPEGGSHYLWVEDGNPYTHAVFYDPDGKFYIGCGTDTLGDFPALCETDGSSVSIKTSYKNLTKYRWISAVADGYVMSYQGEPDAGKYVFYGGGSYNQAGYAGLSIDRDVQANVGMDYVAGAGMLNIYDDTNYDLYLDEAKIGDSSDEFGVHGGHFTFMLEDGDSILWVCGVSQTPPGPVVLMTEDQGVTWDDKTGNLYSEIGNWTGGFASGIHGIVRVFMV